MIKISIAKKINKLPPDIKAKFIIPKLKEVCKNLKINNIEFEIVFCSNQDIQKLNKKYRNLNEPTDVLSFSIQEKNPESNLNFLGSIIVSVEKAIEQSKKYKCTVEKEIYRLLIHGLLHLIGQHHNTNEELEKVKQKTNELLKKIGV